MSRYSKITSMSEEEVASWLSKYCSCDESPWGKWLCEKYCEKCPLVKVRSDYFGRDVEAALCEKGECPYGVGGIREYDLILAWLKSDDTEKAESCIYIDKGDITKICCDAIVNAANCTLLGGGGVDGAIHAAAGPMLLEECATLGGCDTGEAKITKGYDLDVDYVIHTVGPVYSGEPEDAELLRKCYLNAMNLAKEHNIHSIAFPAISTGVYGYPLEEAAEIAMKTVKEWLNANRDYYMFAIFSCFDDETYETYKNLKEEK